ncbi:ATP-binding cassette domain-containing protein [Zwartia sp.]|uniref:ABC transporter ATP-binding protein n=1 Tax=Zwartia sp. TaxID=2978004 RepID=UPI00271C8026|nr:ATP-binding cassette domain-containing protein [Zwartia sp.]MDO9023506.1 ATP-binding cassette domain-containing protein [Zwartia sp.]
MTDYALQAKGLCKHYEDGNVRIDVLTDVSLDISRGELVAVIGASGSGKSTLLHTLGLLDLPVSGTIHVAGQSSEGLSESARSRLRNRALGFVYQFHHLLPEFSALDNVAMPLIVRRESRADARVEALKVLKLVGLSERITHFPGQLSGGERQRVALARALVTRPACVLADEPTGNLDRHTAHQMFKLLKQVNAESGTAFLIVTHDPELAALADRRLFMDAGRLVDAP